MKEISLTGAVKMLKCHGNRYVSMINFLQLNRVKSLEAEGDVIIARFWSDDGKLWTLIAADTPEQMEGVRQYVEKDERFAVLEEWMYPWIVEGRELVWDEPCFTYYLPEEVELPEHEKLPTIPLAYAGLIKEYWSYEGDWTMRFILNCLKRGLSSMKLVEERPVAWGATQDDGAMGFMFVLPEHRSQGYAQSVTFDLISKIRAQGQLPFVHIVHTNQASLKLVQKMGFQLLKKIYWLERK